MNALTIKPADKSFEVCWFSRALLCVCNLFIKLNDDCSLFFLSFFSFWFQFNSGHMVKINHQVRILLFHSSFQFSACNTILTKYFLKKCRQFIRYCSFPRWSWSNNTQLHLLEWSFGRQRVDALRMGIDFSWWMVTVHCVCVCVCMSVCKYVQDV